MRARIQDNPQLMLISLKNWIRNHPSGTFVFFSFALTWSVHIPAALSAHGMLNIFVPRGLQTLASLSPGVVALFLVAMIEGTAGLKRIGRKLLQWRVGFRWYFFAVGAGALFVIPALLTYYSLTGEAPTLGPAYTPLFIFLVFIPFSPLWEEMGWRGFLLPSLQAKAHALKAGLTLGLIWGIWHLPFYLATNPEGVETPQFFLYFLFGTIPLACLFSWLYNRTGGSLLLTVIFHSALNATIGYTLGGFPTGELRPFLFMTCFVWIALLAVLAVDGTALGFREIRK